MHGTMVVSAGVSPEFLLLIGFAAQIARRGRIEIAHSSTFHTFDALPR